MERPCIICHMVTSIDGKVTGEFLKQRAGEKAAEVYYELHRQYQADAFCCGRVTMEGSFTGGHQPELTAYQNIRVLREDYVAASGVSFYAVAFDRHGRLGWISSHIADEDPGYDKAHIIEVLCEDVSDAYLAYLREIGVSYIFAGAVEMNLSLALEKLKKLFGIHTLLLEGGSIINGAFAREGLIDALSLVVAPIMGDKSDKPLFWDGQLENYQLRAVSDMGDSIVWLQYDKTE